jgi:hydroxyacyl-ACP dehydratase HTD2-like protein with hotdog domain
MVTVRDGTYFPTLAYIKEESQVYVHKSFLQFALELQKTNSPMIDNDSTVMFKNVDMNSQKKKTQNLGL